MTVAIRLVVLAIATLAAGLAPRSVAHADDGDDEHLLSYHLARRAFALEMSAGVAFGLSPDAPHVVRSEGEPIGGVFAGTAIGRLGYFVSPFFDVAYYSLGATTDVTNVDGEEVVLRGGLSLLSIGGGLMLDVWFFRARFGLVMNELRTSIDVDGVDADSARLSLGYLFGLAGFFRRGDRVQLGLEARAALDVENSVAALTIGIVGGFDLVQ